MSWTLTAPNGVTATVPDPRLGDTWQTIRRQVAVPSDGGQVWIQDLCVEDQNLLLTWVGLGTSRWSQLLAVLRAANWQGEPLEVSVDTPDAAFPVGIAPGMEVDEVAVSPEQGFSPGDVVNATKFTLRLFLDQDSSSLEHQRNCYSAVSLRFRFAPIFPLEGA